jgi:1-acyl-sn-glycerol-3-phosphate acyltransferase
MRTLLVMLIRFAISLFYREVRVVGADRIPVRGPLLVAANHFNSLADALILMSVLPRRPAFASAVFLFRKPLLGTVMRWMECVPIHRGIDEGADPRDNAESLDALGARLRQGGAVLIFPEGISRLEPRLQKIKVGTARIAFAAEEAESWRLGLSVLPVGLQYEDSPRWRSAVRVEVGEAIPIADYRAEYEAHQRRAMGAMTRRLEEGLRSVSLHAETWEDRGNALLAARCHLAEAALGHVRALGWEDSGGTSSAGTTTARTFLDWQAEAARREPARLRSLLARLRFLRRSLRVLEVEVEDLDAIRNPGRLVWRVISLLAASALGAPVAWWGRANAWPAKRLIIWYVSRFNKDGLAAHSTWVLIPGLVIAPVCFLAQSVVLGVLLLVGGVGLAGSVLVSALYLATLFPAWWLGLRSLDRLRESGGRLRALAVLLQKRRVAQQLLRVRRSVVKSLDRIAESVRGAND